MLNKTLITFALLLSGSVFAGTPVKTLVPVENVYSPSGFDSNDNTEIIVSGYLPNLCHKKPETEFKITGNKIEITLSALKYDPSNPFCAEMIVPFLEKVDVGVLDKGTYDIVVNGKTVYEKSSEITIGPAYSDAIDEFVYANVEYVEKNAGTRTIKLKGHTPSDCFVYDKASFANNKKDTYSILPKMKQISDFCPMKMVPFEVEEELPNDLKADKLLLHVRVMNGKSVNTIFYNNDL